MSGSFASICRRACDNDPRSGKWSKTFGLAIVTPPAQIWAGWRATNSKCDERRRPTQWGAEQDLRACDSAERSDASALSAFFFSGIPLTTYSPTISRKNYKVLSSHHIEKRIERNSQEFFYQTERRSSGARYIPSPSVTLKVS